MHAHQDDGLAGKVEDKERILTPDGVSADGYSAVVFSTIRPDVRHFEREVTDQLFRCLTIIDVGFADAYIPAFVQVAVISDVVVKRRHKDVIVLHVHNKMVLRALVYRDVMLAHPLVDVDSDVDSGLKVIPNVVRIVAGIAGKSTNEGKASEKDRIGNDELHGNQTEDDDYKEKEENGKQQIILNLLNTPQ